MDPYAPKISRRWFSLTFLVSFSTTICRSSALGFVPVTKNGYLTLELLAGALALLTLRVKLLSLCRWYTLPPLLLLDTLLAGLLLRLLVGLNPLRRLCTPLRAGGVLLGVLDLERDRGDIERRGERDLERLRDLANAGVIVRVRDRPREGDLEGIENIRIRVRQ